MTISDSPRTTRLPWEQPEIRELDVRETSGVPGSGGDVAGTPFADCQRS